MDTELHSINAMRNMEIIDISTGAKIGFIKDLKIDSDTNKIISLILPGEVKSWFGKEEDEEIPWSSIVKIGLDVILVQLEKNMEEETKNI